MRKISRNFHSVRYIQTDGKENKTKKKSNFVDLGS